MLLVSAREVTRYTHVRVMCARAHPATASYAES
jgi:hypothetical protein